MGMSIIAAAMVSISGMAQVLPIMLLAMQPYLTRPDVDFDLVIDALKDQGQWVALEEGVESYYFQPGQNMSEHIPPYQNGQWFYTDYGWTWKGVHPASWAIDHYGFWSKGPADAGWVWTPGKYWLPSTVEWLQSGEYYGWRACHLDRFSNPVEPESRRYSNPDEWNFLHRDKMRQPFTAADLADREKTIALMEEAIPVDHIYQGYRDIARPGPDPVILSDDPEQLPLIPVTMSLPDLRHRPKDPKPDQYFIFRPEFYQDSDGIMKRIHLFLNPRVVPSEQKLKEMYELSEEEKERRMEMIENMEKQRKRQEEHWERLYD